jgi:N-acetylmuramic acid 6-phosphate etherase
LSSESTHEPARTSSEPIPDDAIGHNFVDRGDLSTEQANEASADLDTLETEEAVALFAREDAVAVKAVELAQASLVRTVDIVANALAAGGRLIYVGAGTSGRLGMLDAIECPPTFRSKPEQVQALLAGGSDAMQRSVEGAEDEANDAGKRAAALRLTKQDVVLGITAGGTTPFVHGALREARRAGAHSILLACVDVHEYPDPAYIDFSIRLNTGPEIIAGSTRLKAGTATKLALNTISSLAMVRLGKVHGNLMVDVNTRANAKLTDRGERLVMRIANAPRERAHDLLETADGEVKTAIVMAMSSLDAEEARAQLQIHVGRLRETLTSLRDDQPTR